MSFSFGDDFILNHPAIGDFGRPSTLRRLWYLGVGKYLGVAKSSTSPLLLLVRYLWNFGVGKTSPRLLSLLVRFLWYLDASKASTCPLLSYVHP